MDFLMSSLLLLAFLVGHFGLWIAIYNRINAFDLPRRLTKPLMKLLLLLAVLFPLYLFWCSGTALGLPSLCNGRDFFRGGVVEFYFFFVLSSYLWLGIPWLSARPILGIGWLHLKIRTEVRDLAEELEIPLPLTRRCALFSKLPLNQIFDLAVEYIELPVRDLPDELDGYRIAHLSDIHLTGDVSPRYTSRVIELANQWNPELFALTGDLVDSEVCIDWLQDALGQAKAADGAYFILGNHDARMAGTQPIRDKMVQAGWFDLGGKKVAARLRQHLVTLVGNEAPWLKKPPQLQSDDPLFRLMLSHSPDQIAWARSNGVQLMLAGHTHGGQGRLPLAGPILSPSRYGSRYASGQFDRNPTTLHVTRGLSGTRLMRINCRPELSLLTLRQM